MRTLYVDASQGASGDMLLGAFVDLGVDVDVIRSAIARLPIEGWSVAAKRIVRCALAGTKVDVAVAGSEPGRNWSDLETILTRGGLSARVRDASLAVFRRLIEAEAVVHDRPPEAIHLHEAGATDAIVDVVGSCAALEHLRVDRIVVSALTTGFGEVRCAHGVYPVPAPATALLVRGVPVRGGDIEAERLTPTGAAILTTLADAWGSLPEMRPIAIGLGAGSRDLGDSPNMLRLILGSTAPASAALVGLEQEIGVIECTIDDATPQALAFEADGLRAAGALDVVTTAVAMKKGRVGHQLVVLARPEDAERLARRVLERTSTLGVRLRTERRLALERRIETVRTELGDVRIKLAMHADRILHVWPEYDDCAALAAARDVPLTRVQQTALEAWAAQQPSETTGTGRPVDGRKEPKP